MHNSKHARTSCYIHSALDSPGQALSQTGGSPSIHIPLQYADRCQRSNLSVLPDAARQLQLCKADGADGWKKKGLETDENRPTLQYSVSIRLEASVVSRISIKIPTNKSMSESTQEQAQVGCLPGLISILYCSIKSTLENADKKNPKLPNNCTRMK